MSHFQSFVRVEKKKKKKKAEDRKGPIISFVSMFFFSLYFKTIRDPKVHFSKLP